ncbi:Predicted membrane protein [Raineyella antarctica]|uniref:Predicted membrane protein n=1 Tax=Raineyella antarctica TaxID=1577474 RepID=A0A1G6HMZ7_9ACTN|nr:DUF2207 domain-containing protein [Raineyella antarctica]SDB95620.1 Predicted membrane protein [Raineyella antarctica]
MATSLGRIPVHVHLRLLSRLAAALLLVAGPLLVSPLLAGAPAHAADTDPIRRMDVTAVADRQGGTLHVTQDFDMEFTGGGDHGPFVYLVTRQAIAGDDSRWRVLEVSNPKVTSPTGAPAKVTVEKAASTYGVRIGDPNRTVKGTQRYVLTYDLSGVVNPNATGGAGDEVNWNVIGTGWEVPMQDVTVTIEGPAAVTGTACYAGDPQSGAPCTATASEGNRAVFSQAGLGAGQGLTVVGQWPVGTFVGAEPVYVARHTAGDYLRPTAGAFGVGLGSLAVLGALALLAFRRFGRDQAYVGLTPGLMPAPGQQTSIGPRRRTPVAVRFTPPEGVTAGEIGVLVDGRAGTNDVVAGIVDLAVRGYLRIDETAPPLSEDDNTLKKALAGMKGSAGTYTDWRLVRLQADRTVLPRHLQVLDEKLFRKKPDPLLRDDLQQAIAGIMMSSKSALLKDMVARGWYRRNPAVQQGIWLLAGVGLIALGVLLGIALGLGLGWGLAGIGPIVAGIAVFVAAFFVSSRTAEGSAVLAQAEGFKEYLLTAEADQIRVEEDQDVFSRYLPWAIAFGAESHWVGVFREIAASGRPVPEPYWYHSWAGVSVFAGDNAFFGAQGSFMDAASHSGVWAAGSGGAGGLSGMSGGSVGGGVGGGGGGSW